MGNKPAIKSGWVRALIFLIVFLAMSILLEPASGWVAGAFGSEPAPSEHTNVTDGPDRYLAIRLLLSFLVSLLLVFGFRKLIDRKSITSLGLTVTNKLSHAATGFFIGILLLGAGSLLLAGGNYLDWMDISFDPESLFISFVWIFCISFAEEFVFRGYILYNLMESMNKWTALVLSAALFACFHFHNPAVTPIALANIFLGGLLLGINFIYTRNLWFGILLHFTWNFYQGPVLGYRVSGLQLESVLEQELTGNPLITGGDFGFEASALDGMLTLVATLILAWVYEKQFGSARLPEHEKIR